MKKINVLVRQCTKTLLVDTIAVSANKIALREYLKANNIVGSWADNKLDFLSKDGLYEYSIHTAKQI